MKIIEGAVDFRGSHEGREETWETWYRVVGDLRPAGRSGPTPLAVLHGGPGATHDCLRSLSGLARDGRAVVCYDQLGNGRSMHLPGRGADFWTVGLFPDELRNLVAALGLGAHHVLGQCWGGFLAQEYALTRPRGLKSLVLADTAASFPDFAAERDRLRANLPPGVEATLRRHEEAGSTDSAEYAEACGVFHRRHVCRLDPWPPEVMASFGAIEADRTVCPTRSGPSGVPVVESLRDWEAASGLGEITAPTLLVSGRHDEATPALQETLRAGIPDCAQVVFEESSHMPHLEERDRYLRVVGDWLRAHD